MRAFYYILAFILLTSCTNQDKIVSLVKYENKYGFIDKKGNWIIEPTFDSLGIFYDGYATSYQDNKMGKIDYKGNLIIDYKFDFIGNFENGLALVILNDSINYVDLKGELRSSINFWDGESFSCGLAPVQPEEDGKWGYINVTGELISTIIFDYAGDFKDNKAKVEIGEQEFLIDIDFNIKDTIETTKRIRNFPLIGNSDGNSLGKLNSRGDTIMTMNYKSFGYNQDDIFWFNNGKYYGLVDTTGKFLSETQYEYLTYFSDNGLAIAKLNGKYGYIDKKCQTIINYQFEDSRGFKYGLAAVKKNDKWGFINEKGDFVIEPKYDYVGHQFRPIFSKYEPMYDFDYE
ncbi:WG repeat-containing protein [Saccharicrinis sp. FJH2]|uniref:WG repeat-containing protein n=1 Tax=Saccharicrinis sp. FJH65 TaxID=3344659 RepID=UPI0035F3DC93